jgi:hypothetical protein
MRRVMEVGKMAAVLAAMLVSLATPAQVLDLLDQTKEPFFDLSANSVFTGLDSSEDDDILLRLSVKAWQGPIRHHWLWGRKMTGKGWALDSPFTRAASADSPCSSTGIKIAIYIKNIETYLG